MKPILRSITGKERRSSIWTKMTMVETVEKNQVFQIFGQKITLEEIFSFVNVVSYFANDSNQSPIPITQPQSKIQRVTQDGTASWQQRIATVSVMYGMTQLE